jgi:hypothetical protein
MKFLEPQQPTNNLPYTLTTLRFLKKTTRAIKHTCSILASESLIGAMDWPIESTIN